MKRIISIICVCFILLTAAACRDDHNGNSTNQEMVKGEEVPEGVDNP